MSHCSLDPFIKAPNALDDERKNPPQTPLHSPPRYTAPITPQPKASTPLYRRFLEEVTRSPVTPPRSPSPTKRWVSPGKKSDSRNGRDSPNKFRLEVGIDGFHFQCEIPERKIVGGKSAGMHGPGKMCGEKGDTASRAGSPKRASPAKHVSKPTPTSSPALNKKIPGKAAVGDAAAVKSSATRNGLPRKSAPTLSHTPRSKTTTPSSEKRFETTRSSPHRSVRKMATASATSTASPRHAAGDPPTRAQRGHSFDIGDMMAGLKAHASKPAASVVERIGELDISEPPTPLRKAAEKLQPIARIQDTKVNHIYSTKDQPFENTPVSLVESAPLPFKIKDQSRPYQPLPVPPPEPSPSVEPRTSPPKQHVELKHNRVEVTKPPVRNIPGTLQRNGTDPSVMLAMQHDMAALRKSLRSSLHRSHDVSNGKEKTSELPNMVHSVQELGAGMPAMHHGPRQALTSDLSCTKTLPNSSLRCNTLDVCDVSHSLNSKESQARTVATTPSRNEEPTPNSHAENRPQRGKTPKNRPPQNTKSNPPS